MWEKRSSPAVQMGLPNFNLQGQKRAAKGPPLVVSDASLIAFDSAFVTPHALDSSSPPTPSMVIQI